MNDSGGKIRLGISSCLLGNMVRYDGGHKLDEFLSERWGLMLSMCQCAPKWNAA